MYDGLASSPSPDSRLMRVKVGSHLRGMEVGQAFPLLQLAAISKCFDIAYWTDWSSVHFLSDWSSVHFLLFQH
jgi:hypothetical protein